MQELEKLSTNELIEYIVYHPKIKRTQKLNEKLFFDFQKLKYFRNILQKEQYGNLMLWNLTTHLQFKLYEKDDIIWNINDIINSMYIIIEGQVEIINIKKEKLNHKYNVSELISLIKNNSNNNSYKLEKNIGEELGEKELKEKTLKRINKCKAISKVILGELSNTNYYLIFERTELLEKTSKLNFFENLSLFKGFTKSNFFSNFISSTKVRKLSRGEIIIHKGDKFKTFYIIRSGIFSLSFFSFMKNINPIDLTTINTTKNERFTSHNNHELKQSYIEEIEYKLFKLGPGEFIGDIEYNEKLDKYIFDVKCLVNSSEIFEINLDFFNKKVPLTILNRFKEISLNQIVIINDRINNIIKANKYIDSFYKRFPKSKSIDYNKESIDFSDDTFKKKKYNKINLKYTKINPKNIIYQNNSNSSLTPNCNIIKKKKFKLKYYIPQNNNLLKKMNYSCDLTTSIPSRKKKTLTNITLFFNSPEKKSENVKINKLHNQELKRSQSQNYFFQTRLMKEKHKRNYSKCFEVNKQFLLFTNTTTMKKKLKKILMDKINK